MEAQQVKLAVSNDRDSSRESVRSIHAWTSRNFLAGEVYPVKAADWNSFQQDSVV